MAKRIHPKKISEIKHESGNKAEIMFNPESGEFYCSSRFIGDRVTGKQYDEVVKAVKERLAALDRLVWEPVIEVEHYTKSLTYGNSYQVHGDVALRVSRFWIARRHKGCPLRSWPWSDETHQKHLVHDGERVPYLSDHVVKLDRAAHAEELYHLPETFALPYTTAESYNRGTKLSFYAYDEALWTALNRIIEDIHRAHEQLVAILGDSESGSKLIAWSEQTHRLSAGTDDT